MAAILQRMRKGGSEPAGFEPFFNRRVHSNKEIVTERDMLESRRYVTAGKSGITIKGRSEYERFYL